MLPDEIMALVFRRNPGEWMLFYSASLPVCFSAIRKIEKDDLTRAGRTHS